MARLCTAIADSVSAAQGGHPLCLSYILYCTLYNHITKLVNLHTVQWIHRGSLLIYTHRHIYSLYCKTLAFAISLLISHNGEAMLVLPGHGRRNFKDTNPLMSSLLITLFGVVKQFCRL